MIIVFARAIILYLFIIIIMRLLGKRQIGQLQPSELVFALVIADLASSPMENIGVPLVNGIIPILTLFIVEKLLSVMALKSQRARGLICGTPSIVIEKGVILDKELQRLRLNINDILEQMRLKGYFQITEVEYAIIETSGDLSVIPKAVNKPLTPKDLNIQAADEGLPVTLIADGRINTRNLHIIGLDENWLMNELKNNNINSAKDIFFAYVTSEKKLIFQKKT